MKEGASAKQGLLKQLEFDGDSDVGLLPQHKHV